MSSELRAKVWCTVDTHLEAMQETQTQAQAQAQPRHTKRYTTALVEVLLARLSEMAVDLEQFSAHDTGRHGPPRVTRADLQLWLRASPELVERLGLGPGPGPWTIGPGP